MKYIKIFTGGRQEIQADIDEWMESDKPHIISTSIAMNDDWDAVLSVVYKRNKNYKIPTKKDRALLAAPPPPPKPPSSRILKEGGSRHGTCHICGSTNKKNGCIQPTCKNYHNRDINIA
jgi:hypothetical protein